MATWWSLLVVPGELAGNKQVITLDNALIKGLLQGNTDFLFIAVRPCARSKCLYITGFESGQHHSWHGPSNLTGCRTNESFHTRLYGHFMDGRY